MFNDVPAHPPTHTSQMCSKVSEMIKNLHEHTSNIPNTLSPISHQSSLMQGGAESDSFASPRLADTTYIDTTVRYERHVRHIWVFTDFSQCLTWYGVRVCKPEHVECGVCARKYMLPLRLQLMAESESAWMAGKRARGQWANGWAECVFRTHVVTLFAEIPN